MTAPPSLGGYPTHGPQAPPRNPNGLYTTGGVALPVGSTGSVTTDASYSLPPSDACAPPIPAGPYSKGTSKGPPSQGRSGDIRQHKKQEADDPWKPAQPGDAEKELERLKAKQEKEWKEAGWSTYHQGRWS